MGINSFAVYRFAAKTPNLRNRNDPQNVHPSGLPRRNRPIANAGIADSQGVLRLCAVTAQNSPFPLTSVTDDAMKRAAAFACLLLVTSANPSTACDRCGRDGGCAFHCECCDCECCPCQLTERTIMVPMCVTETHMKVQIVETMKEREETYTVFQSVPKKRTYSKECCYLETEVKSKDITVEQCRRVQNPVTLEDTVKIPITEFHESVCQREICTICGKVCIEEPCTCQVTRTADMPRVQECMRQDVVFEECKKTIDYCVKTPKFDKKECAVETVCELVPVQKTRKVQVCVPEAVKVPCDVKVTRMVAKKIVCCDECWCALQKEGKKKHCKDGKKEHFAFFKKDKECKTCSK